MRQHFILYLICLTAFSITTIPLSAQVDSDYSTLKEALEQARRTNDYKELADAYFAIALYEEKANRNLENSFEQLSRGLDYYELLRDTVGINLTKYHITRQLLQNDMDEEAYNRMGELHQYYQETQDQNMLSRVEILLFDYHMEKLEVDSAHTLLIKLKEDISSLEENGLELDVLNREVSYNDLMQDYSTALKIADDCYSKSLQGGDVTDVSGCLLARGKMYFKLKDYTPSIADLEEVSNLLSPIPYSKQRLLAYDLLGQNYKIIGNYFRAFDYAEKYSMLQDSILNENRILAINNLTYKYESKEKATEIKLLEQDKAFVQKSNQQQKRALIVLGIALAGLILGIYYIISFYSDKIKSARIIEDQNDKINRQKINELRDRIQINSMESMIEGQEVERERIAKDLHDSLGGLLSTIKLQIDNIQDKESNPERLGEFKHATKLLDVAVSEIRTISQDLQPGALKRLGLLSAINDLVNRYQSENGPEITFQHFGELTDIDQGFAMGIYRIVQEILNNAIKHAKAREIFVQLNKEDESIVIHVEDDGIGFDAKKKYKSMGLENIRSRVNYLKGTLDIDSRIGQGTSFIIHLDSNFNSEK